MKILRAGDRDYLAFDTYEEWRAHLLRCVAWDKGAGSGEWGGAIAFGLPLGQRIEIEGVGSAWSQPTVAGA